MKRVVQAEQLSETIIDLLSTPLSRPNCRAAWTVIDKILNKAFDYDARMLHPESFSIIAARLDCAVLKVLRKLLCVTIIDPTTERNLRLGVDHGGCGIMAASSKALFAHLAGACQYLPAVANSLLSFGWDRDVIQDSIDFSGVYRCLELLGDRGIYVAADLKVHYDSERNVLLKREDILWGQARKLYGPLSQVVNTLHEMSLRETYVGNTRELARLNSASGPTAGKWISAFPSSWWPEFPDGHGIEIPMWFESGRSWAALHAYEG